MPTISGIEITPKHLKISDRASICMPYHKLLDCLEEDRLADKKFGSTRRGISPAYSDRYMKKALRVGELLHRELLDERVADIVEWKNLLVEKGYGHEAIKAEDMLAWIDKYCMPFKDYICDATLYLGEAERTRKRASLRQAQRPWGSNQYACPRLHMLRIPESCQGRTEHPAW